MSEVYDPSFRRTGSECRRHEGNAERTRSACKEDRIRVSGGKKLHCKKYRSRMRRTGCEFQEDRMRASGGEDLSFRRQKLPCNENGSRVTGRQQLCV